MFSVIKLDNYNPSVGSVSYDLVANNIVHPDDFDIPVWLSFSFWVVTEDALAVGDGFTLDLNYVDPTGQTRSINGTPFSLGNAAGFSVVPVTPIQRQSGSSLVELVATRSGAGAGNPIVAARAMVTRLCYEQISVNADWTP